MKLILLAAITLSMAFLLLLNVRLHSPGGVATVLAQLRHLEEELGQGAGDDMQAMFPEGYVLTWVLYGLASAQLADQLDPQDARQSHLLSETRRALATVRSDKARTAFDAGMTPSYGAFYTSWSLYLFAQYIRSAGVRHVSPSLVQEFTRDCDRFVQALTEYGSPFMATYPKQVWPADTPPGIAALGIYDEVVAPRYSQNVQRWVADARARLHVSMHALTHTADPGTGNPTGVVRGESLALMNRILVDIDPNFAREQYAVLREHFLDDVLGIPGVREYARGTDGSGDVDSGPIIFGFSGPSIVVGAAAARVNGDNVVADALFGTVELVGLPVEFAGQRFYAFGALPIGDAFIAWARSSPTSGPEQQTWKPATTSWFVWFHVLSFAVGVALAWRGYRIIRSLMRRPLSGAT